MENGSDLVLHFIPDGRTQAMSKLGAKVRRGLRLDGCEVLSERIGRSWRE